jgi:hypothetical protein
VGRKRKWPSFETPHKGAAPHLRMTGSLLRHQNPRKWLRCGEATIRMRLQEFAQQKKARWLLSIRSASPFYSAPFW